MLARSSRAGWLVAAFAVACLPLSAAAQTTPAKPATSKPSTTQPAQPAKPKPSTPAKKKPAPAKKPAPPPPPPPPPAVELIGYVSMPPGAFRGGPPSGQFDSEGRRAGTPRFDS